MIKMLAGADYGALKYMVWKVLEFMREGRSDLAVTLAQTIHANITDEQKHGLQVAIDSATFLYNKAEMAEMDIRYNHWNAVLFDILIMEMIVDVLVIESLRKLYGL